MKKHFVLLGLAATALFYSCQKDLQTNSPEETEMMTAAKRGGNGNNFEVDLTFYALAEGNRLDKFSLQRSEELISSMTITGLQQNETIIAIDFRPATGQLYGLGSSSRLYVINTNTGAARAVGMGSFSPMLSGTIAGFDFNPTVDRIRVVTSTGQNLRLHPETGAVVFTDGAINGAPGAMITSVAYTNNEAGVTTTTLYDIDVANDKLYKQNPPNDGRLEEVGPLGIDLDGEGGFDISPMTAGNEPVALALYQFNKKSALFTIDLATGRAKKVEKFSKERQYYALAIPTNPVAYTVSMNTLQIFNPMMPSTVITKNISGLQANEMISGIDFRPANNALYALGSNSRLYTINTSNGAATFVATLSIPLSGSSFGFDFNPVPDRIRIISNTGQNLRVNPMDGVTINDGAINPGPAAVTGAGYTNSFAGTTATTLYVIDSDNDMLYIQNPPNNGTLTNGKTVGVNIDASNGFDIGGMSNRAYGIFTSGGRTRLYLVDLMSGMTTATGDFNSTVTGFAIGLGF